MSNLLTWHAHGGVLCMCRERLELCCDGSVRSLEMCGVLHGYSITCHVCRVLIWVRSLCFNVFLYNDLEARPCNVGAGAVGGLG